MRGTEKVKALLDAFHGSPYDATALVPGFLQDQEC